MGINYRFGSQSVGSNLNISHIKMFIITIVKFKLSPKHIFSKKVSSVLQMSAILNWAEGKGCVVFFQKRTMTESYWCKF